VLKADASILNN